MEASQRQYADVNDSLSDSNRRALNMVHEIEEMRSNLEKVSDLCNAYRVVVVAWRCDITTAAATVARPARHLHKPLFLSHTHLQQHIFTSLASEMKKIPPAQSAIPAHYNARRDPRFLLD